MQMKQNWFSRLAWIILAGALLYLYQFMLRSQYVILKGTFSPVVLIVGVLAAAALIFAVLRGARKLAGRHFSLSARLEQRIAWSLLTAGLIVRILFIIAMPLEPVSDYGRYNIVAEYIANGTLQTDGSRYCDYIALFPGTVGYSVFLAAIYRLFGTGNLFAAQTANAILAVASCFFTWRIARRLAGRGAGLVALALSVFFPSQICLANGLASEFLFVVLLMLSIWLFIIALDDLKQGRFKQALGASVLIGAVTAVNQNIRAIAGLLVVAAVICLLSMRRPKTNPDVPPLAKWQRFSALGCAALMIASFSMGNSVCSAGISKLVDRELAGGVKKIGWYLFVGFNRESVGTYNLADVSFWNEIIAASQTPAEAHAACFDAAVERAASDIGSLPKLLVGKYEILWGDDGFSCDYNRVHMGEQGSLTPARDAFLRYARIACSLYYFAMLVLSGVYAVQAWKKRTLDGGYVLVLLWLGTIAAHLVLEIANRYHYHVLSMMPILAAIALSSLWRRKTN